MIILKGVRDTFFDLERCVKPRRLCLKIKANVLSFTFDRKIEISYPAVLETITNSEFSMAIEAEHKSTFEENYFVMIES